MEKLLISGGKPLKGEVRISGAKNSVLPILAASLLSDEEVIIGNVPHLQDVTTTISLLTEMGATLSIDEKMKVSINSSSMKSFYAPYEMVKTMRASILVLGPLLAHFGIAKVSLPGGCAIGSRPVNLHIEGLKAMGANIKVEDGYIIAKAKRLKGAKISLPIATVTGTENLMMAATLASGKTVIKNAAKEPEIIDLANCLRLMGASIEGDGTSDITIIGVKKLSGCNYDVLPDRIETATFLVAAAITKGNLTLTHTRPDTIKVIINKLRKAGAKILIKNDSINIEVKSQLNAVNIITNPYPDFPTDMQAQFIALNSISKGKSKVVESVFENRFMHVQELVRMGADIEINGNTAIIKGVQGLTGASVMATDLRASASLILAGLVAKGETIVDRIYHIDRGYECIEEKLTKIGASIKRLPQ
jgi:UDP-N-acetylglucosamine 1-carboxyvinyltransferase